MLSWSFFCTLICTESSRLGSLVLVHSHELKLNYDWDLVPLLCVRSRFVAGRID